MKITGVEIENNYIILNTAKTYSFGRGGIYINYANNKHRVVFYPTDKPRKPYHDTQGDLIIETKLSPMAVMKKLKII